MKDASNSLAKCIPGEDQFPLPDILSIEDISKSNRDSPRVRIAIVKHVFRSMYLFTNFGNGAYSLYLQKHPELRYRATMLSNEAPLRTPHLFKNKNPTELKNELRSMLNTFDCSGQQTCSCATPTDVTRVQSLPFLEYARDCTHNILLPQQFINGTRMLNL